MMFNYSNNSPSLLSTNNDTLMMLFISITLAITLTLLQIWFQSSGKKKLLGIHLLPRVSRARFTILLILLAVSLYIYLPRAYHGIDLVLLYWNAFLLIGAGLLAGFVSVVQEKYSFYIFMEAIFLSILTIAGVITVIETNSWQVTTGLAFLLSSWFWVGRGVRYALIKQAKMSTVRNVTDDKVISKKLVDKRFNKKDVILVTFMSAYIFVTAYWYLFDIFLLVGSVYLILNTYESTRRNGLIKT
jgi:hypothetical protein